MADSEPSVSTPKKKNRPPRKKNKNDVPKNDGQKNLVRNSAEPSVAKGGGFVSNKTDANVMTSSNANGGSATATPEKKISSQRNFPHNFEAAKKKNNNSAKKVNSSKVESSGPTQSYSPMGEASKKVDSTQEVKSNKNQRAFMYQMEMMQRRQIETERKRKWHDYFLSKPHELLLLDRNKIILLKTVEKSRPQAQFFCKVCKYYCDKMSVVATHIRKTMHIRQLQDYNDETTIRELPEMTRDQLAVLNKFLIKQANLHTMDPMHLEIRRTIGVLVSEVVSSNLPGCSTRLFGSSIHGLGLKSSDVNIDLQVPEGSLPPQMLKEVANLLRKSPHFVDVVENFHCEFPFVSFKYKKSGENCSLSLNNERAVGLAVLLSKYTPLDSRLIQLATLFRLWGQLTQTDKAQDGTWPGYAFYLLTIFYLQRCQNPVLPVLNDFLPNTGESDNNNTAKVLALDISEIKQMWKSKNSENLASLWLGLLRFYTVEFNYTEYMVCIDSSALQPRKTRKLFIVDPFLPTRNVARSITSNATFYYIMGCLMTTCRYFSMPQTKFGPLFGDVYVPAAKYYPEFEALIQSHDRINSHLIHTMMRLDPAFQQPRGDVQQCISDVMHLMHNHDFRNVDNIPVAYLDRNCVPPRHQYREMSVSPKDARQIILSFSPKFMDYSFATENFTGGEMVPKICGVCKREGHLKDDCPEEKLPPLDPLPICSLEEMQVLDKLCYCIFDKWKQSDEDIHTREKICRELQDFIGEVHPTVKLELFGSTKNGFGLKGSDMDICLTFEDNKTGEGLDTRGFIEVLYRLLKTFKDLQDLLPIATAKVPIVKFTHKPTRLDGDISLYNVLALENSKLLCTYAQIDVRARVLGYMMKRFSKVCHIGDASKGSLSSYAYTLMVIYFLQRCDPPVLPVLQELTESGGPPPKHIVEGCNAYFFSDLSKLGEVWPGRNKNTMSVGQLWLNLLVFYTEQFDMLNNVICIRCSRDVSKFEKLWISKGIAIEDPFDLSHNLGSALTRKMSLYIIKALRKGRNHFSKPAKFPQTDGTTRGSKDIEAYFMDVKELTDGEPPNDRGCRFCKSIGHRERECPEKKKNKGRKGIRNRNKTQNETPVKQAPASEDDEDDDPDASSDSENGSSDAEQEKRPREVVHHRQFMKQVSVKSDTGTPFKQNRNSAGTSSGADHASNPSPSKKTDRQNVGFKQTIPPGFMVQDPNRIPGSAPSTHPNFKNPNLMPRVLNQPRPQMLAINHGLPASNITPKNDMGIIPQNQMVANKQALIPTVVFSNSKLNPEPMPNTVSSPVTPMRYPFPPGQETSRPPPGFIPISPGPQFSTPPFPHELKGQGQKGWVVDNAPIHPPVIPNVKFPFVPPMSRPVNVSMHPSPPPVGPSPRPTIGPAFNNLQMLGILGPTEQLIWGQSPPTVTPTPFSSQMPTTLGCEAALAKMQINSDAPKLISSQEQFIQNDLSKKETNQNKSSQNSFPPNTTLVNNTS